MMSVEIGNWKLENGCGGGAKWSDFRSGKHFTGIQAHNRMIAICKCVSQL